MSDVWITQSVRTAGLNRFLVDIQCRYFQVGVALLGGFGDLNVDRKATAADAKGEASTALALQPADLMKMRPIELKKKLKEVGVELAKHPGAVEKKVGVCASKGWGGGALGLCSPNIRER